MVIKGDSRAPAPISQPSPVDVGPQGKSVKFGIRIWPVNGSMIKEELYRWLRLDRPTDESGEPYPPGYCHFPQYGEEYFKQNSEPATFRPVSVRSVLLKLADCRMLFGPIEAGIQCAKWLKDRQISIDRFMLEHFHTIAPRPQGKKEPIKLIKAQTETLCGGRDLFSCWVLKTRRAARLCRHRSSEFRRLRPGRICEDGVADGVGRQRTIFDPHPISKGPLDPDGRGCLGPADRLRERREPFAGARSDAPERGSHPHGRRREPRAFKLLKDMGAVPVDVQVRNASICGPASTIILNSEGAAYHEKHLKENADLLEPLVRERLEVATFNSAVDYIKALRVRTVLMEEMRRVFEKGDVLMLPAGNAAPKLDAEIVDTDAPRNPPLSPRPDSFNIANVTGIPAIVLPCGFTAGPPSLPLGIQFCAKPWDEATLFRISHAYQMATDWHKRRPPIDA